ncbi:hypothetical protein GCM10009836_55580 [Pseudonocardia ailaonensis]|uniref:DUF3492 domain-containing protein n=1 Tax=Pseudonocardia ailaonensis TaxID=367279 RepID=A0ABN2NJE6_9PSEU
MKVALVTEGTYPIQPGGVSGWCDQLIRCLPEVEFEVVALSGSGHEPLAFTVPDSVTAVTRIGLWAPPRRGRASREVVERFAGIWSGLLDAVLGAETPATAAAFEAGIRALRQLAAEGPLTPLLRGQRAVDVFVEAWARHRAVLSSDTLTMADAVAVTELIEHFLRPLDLPVLEADLVHATANGPGALMGALARWERGTPVLLSEHGVYLRERMLAIRRSGDSRAARTAQIRFFLRLTDLCYRTADLIAPVSGFNARWALRGGASPERIRIMHNGVDPAALPLLTTEPAAPTVAFVGRIDPLKDIELLVTAFAQVRRQVPGARLKLFGGVPAGNEDYARRCEEKVAALGLGGSVTFEGPVSPVSEAFRQGHLVVLSSKSEGLPLTIIEAAMSGRATVATDVGGMAEAVGDGGLVVPAADATAFAEACVRLLQDHVLRARLAARGRERALEMFSLDRFTDHFRGVYGSLVHRTPIPAPRPTTTPAAAVANAPARPAAPPAVSGSPASGSPASGSPTSAVPASAVPVSVSPVSAVPVSAARVSAAPASVPPVVFAAPAMPLRAAVDAHIPRPAPALPQAGAPAGPRGRAEHPSFPLPPADRASSVRRPSPAPSPAPQEGRPGDRPRSTGRPEQPSPPVPRPQPARAEHPSFPVRRPAPGRPSAEHPSFPLARPEHSPAQVIPALPVQRPGREHPSFPAVRMAPVRDVRDDTAAATTSLRPVRRPDPATTVLVTVRPADPPTTALPTATALPTTEPPTTEPPTTEPPTRALTVVPRIPRHAVDSPTSVLRTAPPQGRR